MIVNPLNHIQSHFCFKNTLKEDREFETLRTKQLLFFVLFFTHLTQQLFETLLPFKNKIIVKINISSF